MSSPRDSSPESSQGSLKGTARGADPGAAQDPEELTEHTLRRIIGERRDKAEALRSRDINPYRNDVRPSHTVVEVRARYQDTQPSEPAAGIQPVDGVTVRVAGRVMARRGFGKTVFVPIRDRDADIQLFLNVDSLDATDFTQVVPLLDAGDIVVAEGEVFWTKRGEMSILCRRLHIATKSLRPLPDKFKGLTNVETRYRQRYLDLAVNPEVREVFRKRSRIVGGIRNFFDARDFLEVETPMMHPIIGGAAARPFTTHHNALDMQLYMRIAPELYLKRLLVGGFERVYEINRNFRNEGLSRQHNPEFTMLEFYWAFADYRDLMDLTEELICELAQAVNGTLEAPWDGMDIHLGRPWPRRSIPEVVTEAIQARPDLTGKAERIFDDPAIAAEVALATGVEPGDILRALTEPLATGDLDALGGMPAMRAAFAQASERPAVVARIVERYPEPRPLTARVCAGHLGYFIFEQVVEETLIQPTFITQFPLAVSPLARKTEADPAFCDRFELFIGGREIANGFSELNDPEDQKGRFVEQAAERDAGDAEAHQMDEDYIEALEYGMPPTAGEGIGIDRMVMLMTDAASIREVILFPHMKPQSG